MNRLDNDQSYDSDIAGIQGDTNQKVDAFWNGIGSVGSFAARNIRGALGASRRTLSAFLFRKR